MSLKIISVLAVMSTLAAPFSVSADSRLTCDLKPVRPFREVVKRKGFLIGSAVNYDALIDKADSRYSEILGGEFNVVVPENAMKFKATEPAAKTFDYKKMDAVAQFASDHSSALHAHCLVWHQSVPTWVTDGKFSSAELKAILQNHISNVAGHLRTAFPKLKIYWDVVNEAVDPKSADGMRKTLWSGIAKTPEESVALAFTWAHAADPKAKLYYNDFKAEGMGKKSDLVFGLVSRLKAKGVPIHGVGLQAHFEEGDILSAADLRANLARYAAIGIEVQFTEMDFRLNHPEAITADQLNLQADAFETVLNACLEARNCVGFTSWGFTDRYSWIPDSMRGKVGAPVLLDENYRAKPAYCRMNARLGR